MSKSPCVIYICISTILEHLTFKSVMPSWLWSHMVRYIFDGISPISSNFEMKLNKLQEQGIGNFFKYFPRNLDGFETRHISPFWFRSKSNEIFFIYIFALTTFDHRNRRFYKPHYLLYHFIKFHSAPAGI